MQFQVFLYLCRRITVKRWKAEADTDRRTRLCHERRYRDWLRQHYPSLAVWTVLLSPASTLLDTYNRKTTRLYKKVFSIFFFIFCVEWVVFNYFYVPLCPFSLRSWSISRSGWEGLHLWKSVYTDALFLDSLIVSQTTKSVKNKAMVDAHGYVY